MFQTIAWSSSNWARKHLQKPFFQSQEIVRPRTGVLELLTNVFYSNGAGYFRSDTWNSRHSSSSIHRNFQNEAIETAELFFHPKLVELRHQIRKAEPVLRKESKDKYINHARRIRMKESVPIPVNMLWDMVRKREKPLTLDINGNHCNDEKVIADKFAEYLMSEQNLHPTATVPQPGESFS